MPVLVWILSQHQAVPTNYRSLEINELLIDWFNPRASYNAVVSAAANEAGGQGFDTELSGPASDYIGSVAPTENDIANIFSSRGDLYNDISCINSRLVSFDGYVDEVREVIPLRDDVTAELFVACVACYFDPSLSGNQGLGGIGNTDPIDDTDPIFETDMTAFEAAVRDEVIQPLLDAGELLEKHKQITRLYTTMSASEMDVDPVFEQNPDLADVSNSHSAVIDQKCDNSWVVTLENGTKVYGSGNEWPYRLGDTDLPVNARILQFSSSGAPEVITDNRSGILSAHLGLNPGKKPRPQDGILGMLTGDEEPRGGSSKDSAGGGGCAIPRSFSDGPPVWLLLLGGLVMAARRKRRV
jgi:hypothetical protein